MPSASKHLNQFSHNVKFLQMTDSCDNGGDFVDWKITTLFYSLMHRIDAVLALQGKGIHPNNHSERSVHVDDPNGALCSIRKEYRKLLNYSHASRYECDLSKVDYSKAQHAYMTALNWIDANC